MHQKYADKGLVAISVNLDDEPEFRKKAEKFLKDNKAAFTNLALDEPNLVEFWTTKFNISALPCVFVFDRKGKWTAFKTEGAKEATYKDVEAFVVKLLAE
jgi:hypothetical protein